mmetsp:Transcript_142284/g.248088  ORF Transcript_142284/g.248088 Transcript_142284/m.248088 type:complete len:269 (-) Transcript_142284:176-982(-)
MGINQSKEGKLNKEEDSIMLPNRFPEESPAQKDVPYGKPNGIPTVIRWTGGAAASVRILGQFNEWNKNGIPLNKSGEDFYIILNLDKGEHEFKFLVDGKFMVDNSQPTVTTPNGVSNVVTVTDDSILGSGEMDESLHLFGKGQVMMDDGYGQEEAVFEETRKFPPLCPPHLRYTPLNSSPQKRYFGDAPSGTPSAYRPSGDPCVLPMPLHVTVNHVYFQRRDGYSLMGTTCRYKSKYCTVVFYKPDEPNAAPAPATGSGPVPVAARPA